MTVYIAKCIPGEAESLRARIAALEGQLAEAIKALEGTREIVSAAAMTGFNYKEGDWAGRLYTNNSNISAVLKDRRVREGGNADG